MTRAAITLTVVAVLLAAALLGYVHVAAALHEMAGAR